jgi:hypothetical protein
MLHLARVVVIPRSTRRLHVRTLHESKGRFKEEGDVMDELTRKLQRFNEAALELSAEWETLREANHPIETCGLYPFTESFDEVARRVLDWTQATVGGVETR